MAALVARKKGHVCPQSNATHPQDRWETMFVYSFICKFTNLRGKVEGLETPMDLEAALLSLEPSPILSQILTRFVLNLRPQTRNLSTDQISTTVQSVLSEYFKSSERTVFWDDDHRMNIDPFLQIEGGFFAADWDFKLKILRQLVELQLCHSTEIKNTLDRAWGVVHNKHKKKDGPSTASESSDPKNQEGLQMLPIGQDMHRKRYWIVDDSPRIYVSTNPWKITATFQTISSTREEYLVAIENLKANAPPGPKKGERRTKLEQGHLALITALESRIDAIDTELARVRRVRKKIESRKTLSVWAELRETRTRRQTQRPDYVYSTGLDSEDDADEYIYQEDDGDNLDDDDFLNFRDVPSDWGSRRTSSSAARRRSTRTAALSTSSRRDETSEWNYWPGERRSTRRTTASTSQYDTDGPPPKRAKTEDSVVSAVSADAASTASAASYSEGNTLRAKTQGAAAVKPTEIAVEQIAGRKKSKFWYYAVEPAPGVPAAVDPGGDFRTNGTSHVDVNGLNGHRTNGNDYHDDHPLPPSASCGVSINVMNRTASPMQTT